jgi:hypothetical protein
MPPLPCAQLDHLAITAPTLAAGVAYVRDVLGVTPQPGGRHPRMGTHNALVKLGEACYLEVIAVDPEAGAPELPRWFRLDRDLGPLPRLATWIARTSDIRAAAAAAAFGQVEPMARGALRWEIALPEGGDLLCDGVAPLLIQWQGPHPAAGLTDVGCALVGLEGFHPRPEAVAAMLRAIGFQGDFQLSPPPPGQPPGLVAHIRTPTGVHALNSSGALHG